MVIAGDTNIYMDATTNPAKEHFRAGWEACGFRRATAGGVEDMTPTLHSSRYMVVFSFRHALRPPVPPVGPDPRLWGHILLLC